MFLAKIIYHLTDQQLRQVVERCCHVRVFHTQGLLSYAQRPPEECPGFGILCLYSRQRVGATGGQELCGGPTWTMSDWIPSAAKTRSKHLCIEHAAACANFSHARVATCSCTIYGVRNHAAILSLTVGILTVVG